MTGFLVLVLVIVGAVFYFLVNLGDLVKMAVEKGGSEATQVTVTLAKAEVKPAEGRATLSGLVVGNPPGFTSDYAFELGSISVQIDAVTITKDVVIINEIVVQDPKVIYELGAEGSNIDAIKKNVARRAGGGALGGGEGPRIIIEHLYIRGGTVAISATALGGKTMSTPLPDIHLTDIGKDKGGADASEIAATVMAALTGKVGGLVSGLDISSVFEGMANVPNALKGMAGGAADKAGGALKKLFGK